MDKISSFAECKEIHSMLRLFKILREIHSMLKLFKIPRGYFTSFCSPNDL